MKRGRRSPSLNQAPGDILQAQEDKSESTTATFRALPRKACMNPTDRQVRTAVCEMLREPGQKALCLFERLAACLGLLRELQRVGVGRGALGALDKAHRWVCEVDRCVGA